ncbi:TfuA-like protein [Sinorhizobium sp. RAC02]|uniref:TfuA-like protein n=1 Tax=Sinorhizobium sp. RAC02 TaxID=1842534 RepID=UPI00083D4334|nr:TfuA-like protein [Sinorhizobium sp. RAC02]AOF90059.1 tfuA-like family protein [Sinorhizobium sp. RAC02]
MNVLFVGPSLPDAAAFCGDAIHVRPPAAHGDVLRAVRSGATAIGIIDGNFEHVAPVWHKEVLHALDQGVAVFGAASMGALRAAECDAFGMIGVGRIYEDYAAGRRVDDADVALLHGPAELGYPALSLPLVNVDATLDRLEGLDKSTISTLRDIAAALFYKDRTWPAIIKSAGMAEDRIEVLQLLHAATVNQKRADALALVRTMVDFPSQTPAKRGDWSFRATTLWRSVADQPETQ